jgi:hypothetical protein
VLGISLVLPLCLVSLSFPSFFLFSQIYLNLSACIHVIVFQMNCRKQQSCRPRRMLHHLHLLQHFSLLFRQPGLCLLSLSKSFFVVRRLPLSNSLFSSFNFILNSELVSLMLLTCWWIHYPMSVESLSFLCYISFSSSNQNRCNDTVVATPFLFSKFFHWSASSFSTSTLPTFSWFSMNFPSLVTRWIEI